MSGILNFYLQMGKELHFMSQLWQRTLGSCSFFLESSEGLAKSMAVNPCSCLSLYFALSNRSQNYP